MSALRLVHVAVGVIYKDGNILIAKRPEHVHQGGLWEFPGGKVEQGESLFAALQRELNEELAIDIIESEPLIQIRHDYGDNQVLLDVHKVLSFRGEPFGKEGQPVAWVAPESLVSYPFPAANHPIITAILLPQRLLITGNYLSRAHFFQRLECALQKGLRLVQLRLREQDDVLAFAKEFASLCEKYQAAYSFNTTPELFSKIDLPNAGLHLNSHELHRFHDRPIDSDSFLSASCHTLDDIRHAEKVGVDYVCLSPVLATLSHPGEPTLGWDQFQAWASLARVPVYALGGMHDDSIDEAIARGAQGIAAISAWWK